MRQVLALPVVVDDGSKVCFFYVSFCCHLILFQLLQMGTQLLSEMLEDSSLGVLIDQVESVRFQAQLIQLHFCINMNVCI
jgi:hypothetical protein